MNILSIDTSGESSSISSKIGDDLLSFQISHQRKERPDWENLLNHIDIFSNEDIKRFDLLVFGRGPGSYTAIRSSATFLKAISHLKRGDSIVAVNVLDQLKRADDKALSKYASSLLAILDDQTGLIEANRVAIEKTPYVLNSKDSHMLMLILPKEGVDVSFLKTLLSDFNS